MQQKQFKKFMMIQVHLKKQTKILKMSSFTLKGTRKKDQIKPNISRKKEIINMRVEINEIKSK